MRTPRTPGPKAAPAAQAWKEVDLWRPFLRRFPDGEAQFIHWAFSPSTGEARGDVIVHWDDDGWSAPHRLRYQVSALLQARAAVCGLSRVLYHQPSSGQSWQYVYPSGHRPWLAGNTLCYTRDFWSRHPFPDLNIGEDARFLWSGPNRPSALWATMFTRVLRRRRRGLVLARARTQTAYWPSGSYSRGTGGQA